MKPFLVLPVVGPDGVLRWHVCSGTENATVVADTGDVYYSSDNQSEAFQALVGAIAEWYRTDLREYDGLNLVKVRSELG